MDEASARVPLPLGACCASFGLVLAIPEGAAPRPTHVVAQGTKPLLRTSGASIRTDTAADVPETTSQHGVPVPVGPIMAEATSGRVGPRRVVATPATRRLHVVGTSSTGRPGTAPSPVPSLGAPEAPTALAVAVATRQAQRPSLIKALERALALRVPRAVLEACALRRT